ncbi:MAG: hypothetical protein GXP27_02395 [Planctomycetes bacterium]|nr:hypothetical protein [Planctomycetota bacterium]
MYFQFACPSCSKNLKVSEENVGRRVRCPYCHNVMTVQAPKRTEPAVSEGGGGAPPTVKEGATPSAKEKEPARPSERPAPEEPSEPPPSAPSDEGESGTDVSMIKSGLLGLALAVAFYVVVALPLHKFYLGQLFLARGWVPFVEVFLMTWALAILYLKSRKLVRQKESMLFDLLPTDISPHITQETVDQFVQHIRGLPAKPSESFLINRVLRGLEHFRVLNNHAEVAARLESQSNIDANSVESSYTLIKVFIWAIPILGFIGTVIGISAAVGGFAATMESAQNVEALKQALGSVTGGLATAFDTTLVALVMSILIMFPTSSMQKSEEDLLNWVDEYCNENFLRRLKDADRTEKAEAARSDIQAALEKALSQHQAELETWTKKLESIGSTVARQVAEGLAKIEKEQQKQRMEEFERLSQTVLQKQSELASSVASACDAVARLQSEQAARMQALAQSTEQTQTQVCQSMRQSAQALHAYFANLHEGLNVLNGVLEELGQKQVVVETAPRRRWGLFGRKDGGPRLKPK